MNARPEHRDLQPGRLWSLWDMLKLDAGAFQDAATAIAAFEGRLNGFHDAERAYPVDDEVRDIFKRLAHDLTPHLDTLDVPLTWMAADRLVTCLTRTDLPQKLTYEDVSRLLGDISLRLKDELVLRSIYVLKQEEAKYFDSALGMFGPNISDKFQSCTYEIEEAGKCLAFERSTACVFHLMRVLEIGIGAVSKCLSIPDPVKDAERNWGTMLRKIREEIDRRSKLLQPQWSNTGDNTLLAEIFASLDAVRNVWRNATMHVETKYTPEEAERIFNAVKGFMMKLASRMDEQGQPLA